MLIVLPVAFLSGILTILAPCTLPMVPLLVGATASGGGKRTAGVLAGFAATFVAVTVVLAALLAAAGVTTDALRLVAAAVLALAGVSLAVPAVGLFIERRLAPVARLGDRRVRAAVPGMALSVDTQPRQPATAARQLAGGAVIGAALGLLWAPCVGPIMAGVIAVATSAGPTPAAVAIALAYVAGAALPLLVVAHWGRFVLGALGGGVSRRAARGAGVMMAATALAVVLGWDVAVSGAIAGALPARWGSALIAVEQQPPVLQEVDAMRTLPSPGAGSAAGGTGIGTPSTAPIAAARVLPTPISDALPPSVALEDLGPAPEVRGISTWINADPLTLASLRGSVVLVHFWTFGCINCQNVQPYVKAWYDRYASAGFVVLGIHTPELSFERDVDNVRRAVADKDVRFPVAVDPDFATWNAYGNSYWPAFYFVDRTGRIRHVHFGEGDYAGSEQVIRELLAKPG